MEFLPLLPNGGTGDDDPDQEQNRNAVFQFFKDYAQNKGSWNSRGVRWFITGDNTGIPSENGSVYFPGFFAEVFKLCAGVYPAFGVSHLGVIDPAAYDAFVLHNLSVLLVC